MISDPKTAIVEITKSEDDDPEEIWNRLGVEFSVTEQLAEIVAKMFGVSIEVALTVMEFGALLAEQGVKYGHLT